MELCGALPSDEEYGQDFIIMPEEMSPAEQRRLLQMDAANAMGVLEALWDLRDGDVSQTIHPAILRTSAAIGFLIHHIVGVGMGFGRGHGFVLRRLEGEGRWSAPSYFRVRDVALGMVVGRRRLQSVLCIKDDATLERFMGVEAFGGKDLRFAAGSEVTKRVLSETSGVGYIGKGRSLTPEELDKAWIRDTHPLVLTYTLAGGTLLDASIKTGVLSVDRDLNKQLMGPYATPQTLLRGEIKQPVEFVELYALLNRLSAWDELRTYSGSSPRFLDSPTSPKVGYFPPEPLPDSPPPGFSPYSPFKEENEEEAPRREEGTSTAAQRQPRHVPLECSTSQTVGPAAAGQAGPSAPAAGMAAESSRRRETEAGDSKLSMVSEDEVRSGREEKGNGDKERARGCCICMPHCRSDPVLGRCECDSGLKTFF